MLSDTERLENVSRHIAKLSELLEKPAPKGTSQRLYRTRAIIEDDYTVFTLVQYLSGYQSAQTPDVKIRLFASRSYRYTSFGATPTTQTALVGQYAIDEIVAFLALDRIPPGDLTWVDETRYILTEMPDYLKDSILHG